MRFPIDNIALAPLLPVNPARYSLTSMQMCDNVYTEYVVNVQEIKRNAAYLDAGPCLYVCHDFVQCNPEVSYPINANANAKPFISVFAIDQLRRNGSEESAGAGHACGRFGSQPC